MGKAIAMIETNSVAKGIEACDYMVKEAEVELLRSTTVCPGKYIVLVGGETVEVTAALKIGKEISGPYLVDMLIIPNIHEQVLAAVHVTPMLSSWPRFVYSYFLCVFARLP